MKFNWGHGVALFFTFFVAVTIYQVIKSRDYDHTLVKEDYYIDDIELDKLMKKRENAMQLSGFVIKQLHDKSMFNFIIPHNEPISGMILFSSPVDKKEDKVFPIQMTGDSMQVSYQQLRSGKWNIHMEWSEAGKEFVYDEKVILP